MWKVTVKGLLAHKLRLALTALAIVLGVTFVSGTLVLTDTLHNTFTTLFGHIYQNIDFEVRGKAAFTDNHRRRRAVRKPIPESSSPPVRAVPGVAYAEGTVGGYAQFVAPDGKAITTGGAPTLGLSFDPNPQLSSLRLIAGDGPDHDPTMWPWMRARPRSTTSRWATTSASSCRARRRPSPSPGSSGSAPPTTWPEPRWPPSTCPRRRHSSARSGATTPSTSWPSRGPTRPAPARHRPVLPPGVEVVTGQTVANEQTNAINQALSFFSTALLVFAFIALFVGGFTIFNTFSIIVGQRTRELALLRIVGASRRQVFRSVLVEAAILGLVASLVGLGPRGAHRRSVSRHC